MGNFDHILYVFLYFPYFLKETYTTRTIQFLFYFYLCKYFNFVLYYIQELLKCGVICESFLEELLISLYVLGGFFQIHTFKDHLSTKDTCKYI